MTKKREKLMETEVEVPVRVDPVAEGGTPMCSALYKAYELAKAWIDEHPKCFPTHRDSYHRW